MEKLLETFIVTDNACLFEANLVFAATDEEIAELTAALDVVRKWEHKVESAVNLSAVRGDFTEYGYVIEKSNVTVSVKTGANG